MKSCCWSPSFRKFGARKDILITIILSWFFLEKKKCFVGHLPRLLAQYSITAPDTVSCTCRLCVLCPLVPLSRDFLNVFNISAENDLSPRTPEVFSQILAPPRLVHFNPPSL
ncbi:hypothetical protein GDO81_023561 [Engystomops pustulosus]|uniref:Uncharacterized protein n=1 Tax=Engystomops pustulosus TaxID=76066 RepID=A0AAV6YMP9_ENGPU|nr:hypothetical protein GDO81_023561 [Engystomops pustulosus]